MASKQADDMVLDRPASPRAPVLAIPLGRGGRGKSEMARWLVEVMGDAGRTVVAADFDRTNPTLSTFLQGATQPPSAAPEDVKLALEQLLERQIEARHDVVLDLGGGDLTLKDLAREIGLVEFLQENGVTPAAIHMIGPDLDDLAYLQDMEADGLFAPPQTLLVLNKGVVPAGRSAEAAFDAVMNHSIFRAAVARGAVPVTMPALGCMHTLDRRRIGFAEAEAGAIKDGVARVGPLDRSRVKRWRQEMADAFRPALGWFA